MIIIFLLPIGLKSCRTSKQSDPEKGSRKKVGAEVEVL